MNQIPAWVMQIFWIAVVIIIIVVVLRFLNII
jgi:hypothetical protein